MASPAEAKTTRSDSTEPEEQLVVSEGPQEAAAQPEGEITTMMIRNVPRKYTSAALTRELQETLPSVSFNFVYLPWDSKASTNLGYGFVNFISTEEAFKAQAFLDGKTWCLVKSNKTIKMVPANRQGLVDNVRQYLCNTSHTEKKFRPVVILDGQELDVHDAAELLLGASFVPPPPPAAEAPAPAPAAAASSQRQPSKESAASAAPQKSPGSGSGRKAAAQPPTPTSRPQRAQGRPHAADLDNNWRRSSDSRPAAPSAPLSQPQPRSAPASQQHLQPPPQLPPQPSMQVSLPPPLAEAPQLPPHLSCTGPHPSHHSLESLHAGSIWADDRSTAVPHGGELSWPGSCFNSGALDTATPVQLSWSGLSTPVGAPGLSLDPPLAVGSCPPSKQSTPPGSFVESADAFRPPLWSRHVSGESAHSCEFGRDVYRLQGFDALDTFGPGADILGMGEATRGAADVCGSEFSRHGKFAGAPGAEAARTVLMQSPGFQRATSTVNALLMKLQDSQDRQQRQLQEQFYQQPQQQQQQQQQQQFPSHVGF